MIRSSKTTIRFANAAKREALASVMTEYRRVVSEFIDILWERPHKELRSLLDKETIALVPSTLSARLLQCAGKQASGVVRGTRTKNERRAWQHAKLVEQGRHKQARKLAAVLAKRQASKPSISSLSMELDERFCSIELDVKTACFDGWLTLGSLGSKLKLKMPFRRTKHFNSMLEKGSMKKGVRISDRSMTFMFELPDAASRAEGATAGIDIGMTTLLSCSDGTTSAPCIHGHDLGSICKKIARRKKGSRGFREAQQHRKNYINRQINRLPWDDLRQINIEAIRHLRRGKRTSRFLGHFNYADILERLKSIAEQRGVLVHEMDPAFTSQRCSACGWTRETSRKGKKFQCGNCGFAADADLNASSNLRLDLPPLSRTGKKRPDNKRGFFWPAEDRGKEPMSPLCSKTEDLFA